MTFRQLTGAIVVTTCIATPSLLAADQRVERRVAAMGTTLSILVDAPSRTAGLTAAELAIAAVEEAETRLSTWIPGSELSRFNSAPAGTRVSVSPRLARDLADARRCSVETGGAFTPGMGTLVSAWGLRGGGRRPEPGAVRHALPALGASNLVVEENTATRLTSGFVVEEGAFGKGVALDDAIDALRDAASTIVLDFGGQIAVRGDSPVLVELADPRDRERVVMRLELTNGSVATTGNSQRGIVVDGQRLGHVLDPATGRPSRDFGSVTVWAERAARADCLSTGLYVMGPDAALSWAERHPDVAVVVIETGPAGLRARASANLRDRLRPVVGTDEFELDFAPSARETRSEFP